MFSTWFAFWGLDLSRFPFFVLRYELTLGQETLDPVLRVIAWSLNVSVLEQKHTFYPPRSPEFPQDMSSSWMPSGPFASCWHLCKVSYVGRWPTVGPNGEPWGRRKAGHFHHRFAVVECRGDWKWHVELWGLRRHYKSITICHRCAASTRHGPCQYHGSTADFVISIRSK